MKEVKILRTELSYQSKALTIIKHVVETSDGAQRTREFVQHPGASLVIAVLDNGDFVMERQYRHALRREFVEFPAGKLDKGEDPMTAAKRELKEETGYEASEWKRLGIIHPCIGYSNEFIEIFLAKGLKQGEKNLDPGEELEVFTMSLKQVKDAVREGRMTDGKSICALQFFSLLEA